MTFTNIKEINKIDILFFFFYLLKFQIPNFFSDIKTSIYNTFLYLKLSKVQS